MLILELFSDDKTEITETKMAWGRRGNQVVRKYRCTIGRLKGKTVSSPGACFAAPDIRKRARLKIMKEKFGTRMARKKRINPMSKRIQALNKASR